MALALHRPGTMKSSVDLKGLEQRNLLVGADWALAHGDIGTLIYIAELLAGRTPGALGSELSRLAQQLREGHDGAYRRWPLIRAQMIEELDSAGRAP